MDEITEDVVTVAIDGDRVVMFFPDGHGLARQNMTVDEAEWLRDGLTEALRQLRAQRVN